MNSSTNNSIKNTVIGLLLALSLSGCGSLALGGQAPPFQSGGLGLTRAEWEQQHTVDGENKESRTVGYDNGKYFVTFWTDDLQTRAADTVISSIFSTTGPIDDATLRQLTQTLLPSDAQLQQTEQEYITRITLYRYVSASLARRYPALQTIAAPWQDQAPGTIRVGFGSGMGPERLQHIIISAGTTGIPPRPPPLPAQTPATPYVPPASLPTVPRPLPAPGLTEGPGPLAVPSFGPAPLSPGPATP